MLNESPVVLSTCTDWLVVVTISTGCLLSKRACLLRLNGSMFSVNMHCSRVSRCVDRVSRLESAHCKEAPTIIYGLGPPGVSIVTMRMSITLSLA